LLRERSNIFFVFIFPIALILLIGIQFGGGTAPRIGVFRADSGTLAGAVMDELEANGAVAAEEFDDRDLLIRAVERGRVDAGVFLPPGMEDKISSGGMARVEFVARPDDFGSDLRTFVTSAVARALAPAGAARYAAAGAGAGFDDALEVARSAVGSFENVAVEVSYLGESVFPENMGRFDLGAPQQLVLFTFITTLTGSAALILSRKLGITHRMLATPTPLRTVIVGESLGRALTGLFQGVYIMVVSMVVFGVDWGDPVAAILLLAAFTAAAAGAAMVFGSVFSTEQAAGGIAVMVSMTLAALGGSMLPRQLFPPGLKTASLITPHAWALEGFSKLVLHDGGIGDILPEVGVLLLFAVALFALGTWRLRRTLTSG
jgi:ABC-2 type transport system permease protein